MYFNFDGRRFGKAFISGLSIIGRDKYGVFPLKGKVLNVKGDDKFNKKIGENTEIINLKDYRSSIRKATYSKRFEIWFCMLLTDQDEDGSHIKGYSLICSNLYTELFKLEGFNKSMLTPIVKVTNNKTKNIKSFYNLSDYEKWKNLADRKGFSIKYYKDTSTQRKQRNILGT